MARVKIQKSASARQGTHTAGFANALRLFHFAAHNVPAYRKFLQTHHVNPSQITTPENFKLVPLMTKDNYLRKYPLKELVSDGNFSSSRIISMSSGSTGQPFFWPRGNVSVTESADALDDLYQDFFQTRDKETLCIISYAMGSWIAGTYMYSAVSTLADRGHRLVTVTPGINKDEIIRIIEAIGDQFEQILLMGYPPFVKDIIDSAVIKGVNLNRRNIKFMFSSEHITEKWRDYVLHKVKADYSPYNSVCLYGAADTGIIGMESKLLLHARRILSQNAEMVDHFFPTSPVLPTLVDYDPDTRFVEEDDYRLIITMNNSIPLIRYDIKDNGRLLMKDELVTGLENRGHAIPKDLLRYDRPIIALYGRSDVSAMFYGLNIYPENIKEALETTDLQRLTTGKFVVKTKFDQNQEESLHITLELKPEVDGNNKIEMLISRSIKENLIQTNKEYAKLSEVMNGLVDPIIHLRSYASPEFSIGTKMKWVSKE